jgi:hypothetical protein
MLRQQRGRATVKVPGSWPAAKGDTYIIRDHAHGKVARLTVNRVVKVEAPDGSSVEQLCFTDYITRSGKGAR